jgi:hypothetical protein
MLQLIKSSTKNVLDTIFEALGNVIIDCTQQSFSEARHKVHFQAFEELNSTIVDAYYEQPYKIWRKYRLLAIDGSKPRLPNLNPELAIIFGTYNKEKKSPTAQCSILLDILNNIIIDEKIEHLSCSEKPLAYKNIQKLFNHRTLNMN